jgi:hypothetical protein
MNICVRLSASRTVGFPESGWQQQHVPRGSSPTPRGLNPRLYTPRECQVIPLARRPLRLAPCPGSESRWCFLSDARRLSRAPLPQTGVTRLRRMSCIPSEGIAPPSPLLRAHAPHPIPLAGLVPLYPRVFAGCDESLLQEGGSRHYLCVSFPRCLDPYPDASPGAHARFFPADIGLRHLRSGSASHTMETELQDRCLAACPRAHALFQPTTRTP